jgi:hypothetical protein
MDPYYATGVCCCGRVLICWVTAMLKWSLLQFEIRKCCTPDPLEFEIKYNIICDHFHILCFLSYLMFLHQLLRSCRIAWPMALISNNVLIVMWKEVLMSILREACYSSICMGELENNVKDFNELSLGSDIM